MANRVIGIEYAGDRIKIVEASFGRRLKVYNFAIIDHEGTDPARRVDQFNHALKVRGFEARDAVVAITGVNIQHRLISLPALPNREMHNALRRESKKISLPGISESLWSYDIVRKAEEQGTDENRILLVTAERTLVENAVDFFSKTNLKLQQMTTVPEAILMLNRRTGPWRKDAVRTFVHFSGDLVHILFVQDGVLLPMHFDDHEPDEQTPSLINKLKRSIVLFRKNFPRAKFDPIVFSGDNDALGALAVQASEELGIEGRVAQLDEHLDMIAFRGNRDELRLHSPALAAALGAAWRESAGSAGINLLPEKAPSKRTRFNPGRIARIAFAASLLILFVTGVHYVRERLKIEAVQKDVAARTAAIDRTLQQLAEFENRRTIANDQNAFLRSVVPDTDWSEILRSLSFVVPPNAVFDEILAEHTTPVVITIRGRVLATTAAEANSVFSGFLNNVRGLRFFESVTMTRSNVILEDATLTAAPVSTRLRSKMSFEIQCRL